MVTLIVVAGVAIIAVITMFGMSSIQKLRDSELSQLEEEKERLNIIIQGKKIQLENLEQHIENKTIDRTIGLTKNQIKVLNIYDDCGIRIPVDIIEELHFLNLETEKDIYNFIENQRQYWKLENQKKPFRKVDISV